jgi:hypothetical protein
LENIEAAVSYNIKLREEAAKVASNSGGNASDSPVGPSDDLSLSIGRLFMNTNTLI